MNIITYKFHLIVYFIFTCVQLISANDFSIVKKNMEEEFVYAPEDFITVWQTSTNNETITIPTTGSGYNYTVDWGDGTISTDYTENAAHTYALAGNHTIIISGNFPRIYFDDKGDKDKILDVTQWGNMAWTSMASAFYGCSNLAITATDTPNLRNVSDMSFMFSGATNFNGNIGNWDVSNVTSMEYMFQDAISFNQDLDWNVSKVEQMTNMFSGATNFNGDISNWVLPVVQNMSYMFAGASAFNQNINNFSVPMVMDIEYMFQNATNFNGDISGWSVSNVTDMSNMFENATSFNGDIGGWNVSNVRDMSFMFSGATSYNGDISGWIINSFINMTDMLNNSGMSVSNYDKLLRAWSELTPEPKNIQLGATGMSYCNSTEERRKLEIINKWNITGDTKNCNIEEPLQINVEIIDVTCNGNSDAEIQATVSGGSMPYTYELLNENNSVVVSSQSSNTFINLTSGSYTVRVTDSSNQQVSSELKTINEPPMLSASVEVLSSGNSSSIRVMAKGGLPPFQYRLNDNEFIGANYFENVSPGKQTVTVKDSNGCEFSLETEIAEDSANTLVVSSTNIAAVSCKGLNDAVLQVDVSGGSEPYTYELLNENNSVVVSSQESNIFKNLSSGSYRPRVTDNALQLVTGNTIVIAAPKSPDFDNDGLGDACDDDTDGDGVLNKDDNCPETILGSVVNATGCTRFTLPTNNFTIKASGASCSNSDNGSVKITAEENLNYQVNLNGVSNSFSKTFNTSVLFEALPAGEYEACITIAKYPEYEKCFTVQISEPKALSVSSKIDASGKLVSLALKGGTNYNITLNGSTYTTNKSEITLPLTQAKNNISVKTDKDCQGIYKDALLLNGVLVYPNPIKNGAITISVHNKLNEWVQLTLFDNKMGIALEKSQKMKNGTVTLPMDGLSAGVYTLQIRTENETHIQKILKN